MPRIVAPAFLDPTNTGSSLAASPSRFINTYLESVAPGHGKSPVWRERTPGLRPKVTFPTGPVRGIFAGQLRCFAVGGATFAEVVRASDGTYSLIHQQPIANDGAGVTFCSNGSGGGQLFLIAKGLGYIYDLNTNLLTQISDPNFPLPARACEYLNGFFLVLKGNSRTFRWSAAEDGLVWPGLTVAERSEASDDLISMIRVHDELFLIGERTSEVWRLVADGNNLFEPVQGVLIEHGGIGIGAPQRIDNSLMWCGRNDDGQGVIWRANGYTPERKSTFAIDTIIQRESPLIDTRGYGAFVYQMRGHVFYVFVRPTGETHLVYDVTMNLWHEWAHWDPSTTQYTPHVAHVHAFAFNTHLVGSRTDGTIYEMNQDFEDESIVIPAA